MRSGSYEVPSSGTRKKLAFDLDAHLAGGSGNDAETSLLSAGVEVLGLDFNDVHHLLFGQLGHFDFVRLFGTGGNVGRFLQEHTSGWAFGDEGEGFILI